MKRCKRMGLILAVLAALLLSGTVFAEGEETPQAGEPGDAPALETAAPLEDPGEVVEPADETGGIGEAEEPLDGPGETGEPAEGAGEADQPADEAGGTGEPAESTPEAEQPLEELGAADEPAESPVEAELPQEPAQETGESAADEVKVVDAAGGELGVEAAAAGGDPRWLVGKQWYSVIYTGGTCYDGTVLNETCFAYAGTESLVDRALEKMWDNDWFPSNGLLYVDAGDYLGFSLDERHSGLKGVIGVDGSASTNITGNINIISNFGGFTLSGFSINGGLSVQESAGNLLLSDLRVGNPDKHGIEIGKETGPEEYWVHYGNVTLADVDSSGNNGAGARVYAYGNVKITSSRFSYNNTYDMANDDPLDALHVITFGKKLDMNGVTASNNYGSGIVTWAGKTAIRNVTAYGNTIEDWIYLSGKDYGFGLFLQAGSGSILVENAAADGNENTGMGVFAWGKTPVTLKNVSANGNISGGIVIWSEGNVTVGNSLTDSNIGNGLSIATAGAVRLSSIRASSNDMNGLLVEGREITIFNKKTGLMETNWTSPVSVTLGSPNNIALANHFAENGAGIRVISEGQVTLSNFSALDNVEGVLVDGSHEIESVYTKLPAGAVTIRATIRGASNLVSGNDLGLDIWAAGNVTLDRTRILGNAGTGAQVKTAAMARLTNLEASHNLLRGLDITADGNTVLANLSVVDNGNEGVWVGALGNVTVGGTSILTDNGSDGLVIETDGAVKVSNLDASRNGDSGVVIGVFTPGRAVALSNLSAVDNERYGVFVYADGNVTLSGSSMAAYNGYSGLFVQTSGAVSLTNFQAASNGADGYDPESGSGIYIQSTGEKGSVTLRGVNTLYNDNHGMFVEAVGRITLSGVNTWLNVNGCGANLNSSVGGISLLNSTIMSNAVYGVRYHGILLQNKNNIFLDNQEDWVVF